MIQKDAIYLRKSRADIELEKNGEMETLERHKKILMNLAKTQGFNVVKIYKEVVSGESISARPQMQQMLNDIRHHKYKNILVMEVERLMLNIVMLRKVIPCGESQNDTMLTFSKY